MAIGKKTLKHDFSEDVGRRFAAQSFVRIKIPRHNRHLGDTEHCGRLMEMISKNKMRDQGGLAWCDVAGRDEP